MLYSLQYRRTILLLPPPIAILHVLCNCLMIVPCLSWQPSIPDVHILRNCDHINPHSCRLSQKTNIWGSQKPGFWQDPDALGQPRKCGYVTLARSKVQLAKCEQNWYLQNSNLINGMNGRHKMFWVAQCGKGRNCKLMMQNPTIKDSLYKCWYSTFGWRFKLPPFRTAKELAAVHRTSEVEMKMGHLQCHLSQPWIQVSEGDEKSWWWGTLWGLCL